MRLTNEQSKIFLPVIGPFCLSAQVWRLGDYAETKVEACELNEEPNDEKFLRPSSPFKETKSFPV